MVKLITVAVLSPSFEEIPESGARETAINLSIQPFFWAPVGKSLPFGLVLATEKGHLLQQCGRRFSPSTYLAVGIISASRILSSVEGKDSIYCELMLDCGIPLQLTTRYPYSGFNNLKKLRVGDWIAILGDIYVMPNLEIKMLTDPIPTTSTHVPGALDSEHPTNLARTMLTDTGKYLLDSDSVEGSLQCLPIEAHILELRPNSPEFGLIRKWPFGLTLPQDPDVLSFPTVFVTYKVVGREDTPA